MAEAARGARSLSHMIPERMIMGMKKRWTAASLLFLLLFTWLCPAYAAQDFERTFTVNVENPNIRFVTFAVLGPVEGEDVSFETMTDALAQNAFYQIETEEITPNGPRSFQFTLKVPATAPRGAYFVRMIQSGADSSESVSQTERIYLAADDELETALDEIHSATGSAILEKLDEYIIEKEIIIAADLPELENARKLEDFSTAFEGVRSGLYSSGFESVQDISDVLCLVMLVDALNHGDAAMIISRMDAYNSLFGEATEGYAFTGREGESLSDIKGDFVAQFIAARGEAVYAMPELIEDIRTALGLTIVSYGSIKEKAEALAEYAVELTIDVKLAEEEGVTLTDVARKLSGEFKTPSAVASAFKIAVDKAAEEKKDDDNTGGGKGSGSGGGSKNNSQSFPILPQPTETPAPVPELQGGDDAQCFSDLNESAWAAEEITKLYELDIISGDGGRFYPNRQISRAEFTKLLVLASGIETDSQTAEFTDCSKDDWFYPYIAAAYQAGLVTGREDGSFGARDGISRQDMAVMIQRACAKSGVVLPEAQETYFTDSDEIAAYARQALLSLAEAGIVNGFEDGSVRPGEGTTRAQAAVITSRLLRVLENGTALHTAE